ncbi:MAG: ECF transporter S component [Clostridiaceae bacterium]
MDKKILFLTRTALLLAVAITFQFVGKLIPYNNFIVGPVVNAVLIIATAVEGLWSGIAIAVIAPLVSAFTNKAPIAPLVLGFSPFIIIGNFIYVLIYYLLRKKSRITGIAAGSVLKSGFLYASISVFTSIVKMQPKAAATLTNLFSWPQLLTALVGGAIAFAVLAVIGKSLDYENSK